MKHLVEHGADVNSKDEDNETALIRATMYGHLAVVKLLVEYGAHVNAKNKDKKNSIIKGWT